MTMWGGRFEQRPSEGVWSYSVDRADRRLLVHDIVGSIAHARMLGETGIIEAERAQRIVDGLGDILSEAESGSFAFSDADEDVHSSVERRLFEVIGEDAGVLHTARSRNDQVVLDLRLYLADASRRRIAQLHRYAAAITDIAEEHAETVIASYTHLQQAQPTTLAHHLLSYGWMALRDAERFKEALARIAVSPLGAGASAGSSLPIDRLSVAKELDWSGVIPNSIDAVGSRDFVSEYVFCCAQTMVGLSRISEELILWSSSEFGWLSSSDEVSTGSSALPHKRNPDVAELIRGRTALVVGDAASILSLQKGLPLAYNRDLQEDKTIVFRADDTLAGSLDVIVELLGGIVFHPPRPDSETTSLDLAEALVSRGVPFREAHRRVGELISRLESRGAGLGDASADDLFASHPSFEGSDLERLDPKQSVDRRRSEGSGNVQSVQAQIAAIRQLTA